MDHDQKRRGGKRVLGGNTMKVVVLRSGRDLKERNTEEEKKRRISSPSSSWGGKRNKKTSSL